MDPKTEGEIVSGNLPCVVGGKTKQLPELKWRANREWQAHIEAEFVRLGSVDGTTPAGARAMLDAQREQILTYDVTHALGDLEDATERELDVIYNRLLEISYPKSKSQMALLLTMAPVLKAIQSASANSTSGPSPAGTSAGPTTLRPRSRTAKSSSSTRRRKRA